MRFPRPSLPVSWKYAFGQFVLIVAGVLAALAADSWREGRQERAREEMYLRRLRADFAANEQHIQEMIRQEQQVESASLALLGAMHSSVLPPRDSLAAWLGRVRWYSDFKPRTGTYQALLQTGDLALLRNPEVQARLVAFSGLMDNHFASLRLWEGAYVQNDRAHRRAYDWYETLPDSARKAPPFSAWESRFPIDWEALLRDGEFRSTVDASRMIAYSRRYFYEDMLGEVREVRRMLEAELGESAPEP